MWHTSPKSPGSKSLTDINNGSKTLRKTFKTKISKSSSRKNNKNKKWNESGNSRKRTGKGRAKWNSNTTKLQPMCSVFWTTMNRQRSLPANWHLKISINSIGLMTSPKKPTPLKRKKTSQSNNSSRKKRNPPSPSGPRPNNKFSSKKKSKSTNC